MQLEGGAENSLSGTASEASAAASDIHDGAHGDAGPGDGSGGQETMSLGGEGREESPSGY
jgi:hypothetical protein